MRVRWRGAETLTLKTAAWLGSNAREEIGWERGKPWKFESSKGKIVQDERQ